MSQKAFPFPSKKLAKEELLRDYSIDKIPSEDVDLIIDTAWNRGIEASKIISLNYPDYTNFKEVIEDYNLEIVDKDVDHLVGNVRFFSEYYTKKGKIIMYMKSIKKWAESNDLTIAQAYNLILAHEFFHFLEYTELGFTSKLYQRPIIKIGSLNFGKTGVKAMSEIAAHAFVHELFEKETVG